MTVVEIKNSIHHTVEGIQNVRLLEAVNNLLLESLDPEIVGYIGHTALTKADLLLRALKAEEDIKEGRVYTAEEVRESLKNISGK